MDTILTGSLGQTVARAAACVSDGALIRGHGAEADVYEALDVRLVWTDPRRRWCAPTRPRWDLAGTLARCVRDLAQREGSDAQGRLRSGEWLVRDSRVHVIVHRNDLDVATLPDELLRYSVEQEYLAWRVGAAVGHVSLRVGALWMRVEELPAVVAAPDPERSREFPLCADEGTHDAAQFVEWWDKQRLFELGYAINSPADVDAAVNELRGAVGRASKRGWDVETLAVAAWWWRKLQFSPLVSESPRRALAEQLRAHLGAMFERCF